MKKITEPATRGMMSRMWGQKGTVAVPHSAASVHPRGLQILLAAVLAAAFTFAYAGVAHATTDPGYSWQSGPLVESQDVNCADDETEQEAGAYMSYYFDPSKPPEAGQTYYVAINVTGIGNTCAGIYADIELNLPSGTSLAITPSTPVECFLQFPGASSYESDQGNCPASLSVSEYGYSLDPTNANPPFWPLPQGGTVEVNVPVETAAAGAPTITGVVQLADGQGDPVLQPKIVPIIDSASQVASNDADAVSISYADPMITDQTWYSAAHATVVVAFSGDVWNHSVTTGGAYAEIAFPSSPSSTTPTTNCSSPYLTTADNFPAQYGPATLQNPDTGVTSTINVYPGTPYCFRIWADVGGVDYYGNWEYSESMGSPDSGGPYDARAPTPLDTSDCSSTGGGCITSPCSASGSCTACSSACAVTFSPHLTAPSAPIPTPTPTPAPSPIAPTVSGAAQSHDKWRVGAALAVISKARHSKPKPPVGDTFTFTLNESATVAMTFKESTEGRTVGGKCVAQTSGNKHKPSCTLTTTAGTLSFTGHAGTNTAVFDGRVSAGDTLKPGDYTVGIAATNSSAQVSPTSSLSFTVAK